MKALPVSLLTAMSGGSLIQGRPADLVAGVSKDTRDLAQGEIYVALSGENFEGHDFVRQAEKSGAAGVLVSQLSAATEELSGAVIHVKDTLRALQELARNYRLALGGLQVVGVTGSNGKTSTKDFIAAVLGQDHKVNATLGNLNNHIGLPLTILNTGVDDTVGVWEMGMSNPGEIELLAEMARPDIGVITNVGVAHIEFMKSREAIAEEKGMLAESLSAEGWLILSEEDEFTASIAERTLAKVMTVGIGCGDLRAKNLEETATGTKFDLVNAEGEITQVEISVPGRHMVVNALLAAAVGRVMGVDNHGIACGLKDAQLTGGRLQRRDINGFDILDDSYNANPDSMRAALQTLGGLSCEGRRIAALGVMAELGELAENEHRNLGAEVENS
ncbi:MAG: UDP-N-acetylmuramoyl-tripeptide--D-alanyl-D-alanine ligase, partial [Verrucomicrobia bacterium]|nr:UDP-N-acetylmuramoyl-tripeptide--D-alanyl-D-alanine ligase [Verrucomicrobiota bacterium]